MGLAGCRATQRPEEQAASAEASLRRVVDPPVDPLRVRESPLFALDQFGYRPDDKKIVVLVDPEKGFNADQAYEPSRTLEVRNAETGMRVLLAEPKTWKGGAIDETAGDRGAWLDISALKEPGKFFIYDELKRQRSSFFEVQRTVYAPVLDAALRAFFFNRANFAKKPPFSCVKARCWNQNADHLGPGQDGQARSIDAKDDAKTARDLSGGWWDAGDTNKYTTFTFAPVHQLLTAYEQRPSAFGDNTNLPESGNGIPDILDELLVELGFLEKMQAADLEGGAIIKVGSISHNEPLPEASTAPRFYYPGACSSATITVSSLFAHAARVFGAVPNQSARAAEFRTRALRAWDHYHSHPRSDACDNGRILAGDADVPLDVQDNMALTAAIHLFSLTGDVRFQTVIASGYKRTRPFTEDRFSVYEAPVGDALLFYATLPNADKAIASAIVERKRTQAMAVDLYDGAPERDLYQAYMRADSYHWGSNQARANVGSINFDVVQYHVTKDAVALQRAQDRALGILHYFHGTNPLSVVYLTNMEAYGAERSLHEIYHTWFRDGDPTWDRAGESRLGPAPGYVPGGPNPQYCGGAKDHECYREGFRNEPIQKAYRDDNTGWNPRAKTDMSWEFSEPAIYYQAAYIKLLSKFVER